MSVWKTTALSLLLTSIGAVCFGATNNFELPKVGEPLPSNQFDLRDRIPSSRLKKLPKVLPVYKYSSRPSAFTPASVQALLDMSAFKGTNATALLAGESNAFFVETVKLATPRNLDYFIVAPDQGGILVQNNNNEKNPPADSVPQFDLIREQLLGFAKSFGISTNDMDKNDDGTIHVRRTEDKITRLGGTVNFIARRSVGISRSAAGHKIIGNRDKMELASGINGRIAKFELTWPRMEPVRTNHLFKISEILKGIRTGQVLGDAENEYPSDGIAQITLKDIRILYFTRQASRYDSASTNAEIFPIASFKAAFKSKTGKVTEGGLYAPILDAK